MKEIDEYVNKSTWRINSNANWNYSFSGLQSAISGKALALDAIEKFGKYGKKHKDGFYHIHNLEGGVFGRYCSGNDFMKLLQNGLYNPTGVSSKPAQHLTTAIDHLINMTYIMTGEWQGAQAWSHIDVLLAPYIRKDKLSYGEVKQEMQRLIWSFSFPMRPNFQCYASDTTVLTNRGWLSYQEIIKETDIKVATLNIENRNIEFLKPDDIVKYDYIGDMIHIYNKRSDQLVTPNHRVLRSLHNQYKKHVLIFEDAETFLNYKCRKAIPISAEYIKEDFFISDAELKLHAWVLAEGTIHHSGKHVLYSDHITIYQSAKSIYLNDIRNVLKENNIEWKEDIYEQNGFVKNTMIRFNFIYSGNSVIPLSKQISDIFLQLSRRQAILFLNEYRKGDGSKSRNRIFAKKESTINKIQALAVIAGYGLNTTLGKTATTIRLLKSDRQFALCDTEVIKYDGYVWCVTTKNNTVITKRNGKIAISGNSPFTNLTFGLRPNKYFENLVPFVGTEYFKDTTYSDYQREINMINSAFLDVMIDGADGVPFTFPLPTYNITKDFKWNNMRNPESVEYKIFELASKWGSPYFSNYVSTDISEEDMLSLCCRLRLDTREVQRASGGIWNFGNNTGSLAVFTINMSRLGYLSNGNEKKFFRLLDRQLEDGKNYLLMKKQYVKEGKDLGLFPMTNYYVGDKILKTYFLTVGINGLNECSMNFSELNILENEIWCAEILKYIRAKVLEMQSSSGQLFNFEATPAEGCSYSMAKIDKEKFDDIFTQGTSEAPYYTSNSMIPMNIQMCAETALRHQENLQQYYTGGCIFHIDEGVEYSPNAVANYIRRACRDYKLPYMTWSPTVSLCPDHGKSYGSDCCNKATIYTRVVGYYRPVHRFNLGKQQEFKEKKFLIGNNI